MLKIPPFNTEHFILSLGTSQIEKRNLNKTAITTVSQHSASRIFERRPFQILHGNKTARHGRTAYVQYSTYSRPKIRCRHTHTNLGIELKSHETRIVGVAKNESCYSSLQTISCFWSVPSLSQSKPTTLMFKELPHQSHRKSSTSPGPTVYSVVLLPTSRYISYRQEIDFNIHFVRILTKVYCKVHRK